jgi:hypothetical protein
LLLAVGAVMTGAVIALSTHQYSSHVTQASAAELTTSTLPSASTAHPKMVPTLI